MEYFYKINCIHLPLTAQTTTEVATDITSSFANEIVASDHIVAIVTNLILAVVGVIGISYIKKMKEKRYASTFSFCARLKIRLHIMKTIMDEHKDFILDQLIPVGNRKKIDISLESIKQNAKNQMCETAKDTIEFLKNSEDQMPASEGWTDKCSTLFEFLEDYSRLSDNFEHLEWEGNYSNKKEEYYTKHYSNITSMLKDIEEQQKDIECRMFNTWICAFFKRISRKIKKKKSQKQEKAKQDTM